MLSPPQLCESAPLGGGALLPSFSQERGGGGGSATYQPWQPLDSPIPPFDLNIGGRGRSPRRPLGPRCGSRAPSGRCATPSARLRPGPGRLGGPQEPWFHSPGQMDCPLESAGSFLMIFNFSPSNLIKTTFADTTLFLQIRSPDFLHTGGQRCPRPPLRHFPCQPRSGPIGCPH